MKVVKMTACCQAGQGRLGHGKMTLRGKWQVKKKSFFSRYYRCSKCKRGIWINWEQR